ncbi:mandelate racemase/muconate lactonizing enzyme family protein [Acinetobacter rathckeae]|uniref:mandelate racemase/muconate lactonizing enzyme family protein n=1 Tax=Acinetobacter rathckeae TaxID=2605272 RepID=UPI0018A31F7B|nr:mandelate racemase/muconate lactonizing enzyme family protein [Acinetobacter rathckeae]MBF7688577.1 mandelate racemase/muconate lactonizing enzyme family protein [Acinetobacter rathckeae]MBF7695824.1 mandelate racemase/muconate lactonizing enzyme family protein [Acinetobacter rathckeae]
MKIRLWYGKLHYAGITLHTAASGAVNALEILWLQLDDAIGEVRLNIDYLHGYSATQVLQNVQRALAQWNSHACPKSLLEKVHTEGAGLLAPTRMLLDMALHNLLAKRAQQSLAQYLGATTPCALSFMTNQTLFWGSEAQMLHQAEHYVDRGFTQLKLRTGVADFATDLARLQRLRSEFGTSISLAIDVNGQWSLTQAQQAFPVLCDLGLSYVEQPLAPTEDDKLNMLYSFGMPIMLDESLINDVAIDRLIMANGALWGHLKLVKFGGITPTLAVARRLQRGGIPFMVGQMNEGHAATSAALQLCRLLQPQFAELYGADGLIDDAVSGLQYHHGCVEVSNIDGLGVNFDATRATLIQEF